MPTTSTVPSIKVVKEMPFKGGVRRWSNRYHFNGGTPGSGSAWTTLSDAVVAAEKACLTPSLTIVETIGYAAGSDVPVFSKTYSVSGTFAGSGQLPPGESAALVRYSTPARTVKNHPIYLFNYYHGPILKTVTNQQDQLTAGQRTAYDTYAAAWLSGFSDGTHTCVRAGPRGVTAGGSFTEEYVTHRDFPYSPSA